MIAVVRLQQRRSGSRGGAAWRVLALGSVAAIACVLPAYELGERPCPCIAGYRCEAATQTCVPDEGAGGASATVGTSTGTDAVVSNASTAADASSATDASASTTTGTPNELLFADEFDADTGDWLDVGDGTWSVLGGEKRQHISDARYTFSLLDGVALPNDYEIVSRMRMIGGSNGGAMEVTFRASPTGSGAQYFCNWEPTSETVPPNTRTAGQMLIMFGLSEDQSGVLAELDVDFTSSADYDPLAPITMHARIQGDEIRCWIEEIPAATLTVTTALFATGTVGLKNYEMSTAYDFIRVYALD